MSVCCFRFPQRERSVDFVGIGIFVCQKSAQDFYSAILSSYIFFIFFFGFLSTISALGRWTCIKIDTQSCFYLFRTLVSQKEQYHFRSLHTTFVYFGEIRISRRSSLARMARSIFRTEFDRILLFAYYLIISSSPRINSLCTPHTDTETDAHTHTSVFGGDYRETGSSCKRNIFEPSAHDDYNTWNHR